MHSRRHHIAPVLLLLFCSIGFLILSIESEYEKDTYLYQYKKILNFPATENDVTRLIFVGGSSLAWGIDVEYLQQELNNHKDGKFVVVNTGIHAGIGKGAMLRIYTEKLMQKTDIVIFSPEFSVLEGDILRSKEKCFALWYTSMLTLDEQLLCYPMLIQTKLKYWFYSMLGRKVDPEYSASGFGQSGDYKWHVDKKPKVFDAPLKTFSYENFRSLLMNFDKEMRAALSGTNYYILPTVLSRKSCPSELLDTIDQVSALYSKISPTSYNAEICWSNDLFYNTEYHLNGSGRSLRTQYILDALNAIKY